MIYSHQPFTKTNDEIVAEHEALRAEVAEAVTAGDHGGASLVALMALHQRLGEMWMWAKERR